MQIGVPEDVALEVEADKDKLRVLAGGHKAESNHRRARCSVEDEKDVILYFHYKQRRLK